MKREDVKAIFPNATDGEIDNILNKFGEELNPLKRKLKDAEVERDDAKTALTAAQANEASYKQQLDAANEKIEAGMTAEEKLAQREKEAEDREREFNLKSNKLDAKSILVEEGCFDEETIDAIVEQVADGDSEATRARAQLIVETVKKQREDVEQTTKDALLKGNPKPNGGTGNNGAPATLKDFLALSDAEQIALKDADPTILSQLK